jgi:hypothetical protein
MVMALAADVPEDSPVGVNLEPCWVNHTVEACVDGRKRERRRKRIEAIIFQDVILFYL